MIKEYKFEVQPIYAIGDIHGAFDKLRDDIISSKIENCLLIICGDIGLGFNSTENHIGQMKSFNEMFGKRNIHCLMIRGNHDNPYYFKGDIDFDYVKAIDDYSVITVGEISILAVGGAISIDRQYRKSVYTHNLEYIREVYPKASEDFVKGLVQEVYWANEAPYYSEEALKEITDRKIQINHIVSHTSPSFAFKNSKKDIQSWLVKDETLADDLNNEREVLLNIYNKVRAYGHPLKSWTYGHFHEHHVDYFDDIKFTALNNADYEFDIVEIGRE